MSTESIETVRNFYNNSVEIEWERLSRHPIEFAITKHYLDKYIKPGDKVLDIGGGPGRYSLYLSERGIDVTLFDLSEANIAFARRKAYEKGLHIKCITGDARNADKLTTEQYDHILIMGPMYHLLDENDRTKCIDSALKLLKDGGTLYVSFISLYAGICYAMKEMPSLLLDPKEENYINCYLNNETYSGDAFTKVCVVPPAEILPFMNIFPLEKLHLFGQESITSPCEDKIYTSAKEVIYKWIELAIKTCEREEFLAFSEHLMYIGRKK